LEKCLFQYLSEILTMPRTETLTFDVVDIYHPYLAIFSRGFMNKFDTVIRQ
jgi:hypothetical protein